jgi:hypothetical protein
MLTNNAVTDNTDDYVLEKPGNLYVIYLKNGGTTNLNVGSKNVDLELKWYNPREGGALQNGSLTKISGSGNQSIGQAPSSTTSDWVVIVGVNNLVISGLSNRTLQNEIKLFPNPAKGIVNFSEAIDAEFYNIAGQQMLSLKNASKADISSLSKGIYQIKVNKGSSYKLVVN